MIAGLSPALRIPGRSWSATDTVVLAGLLSAAMVAITIGIDVPVGLALLCGLLYAPLVVVDLRVGIAVWLPLIFLQGIPAANLGGELAGLLIVAAWVGALRRRRADVSRTLLRHRRLLTALVGLLAWLTMSVLWAQDSAYALSDVWRWYAVAAIFVIVATTVDSARSLRLVCYGFVAGGVISAASGMIDGSLVREVDGGARLEGGAGDPNFLASNLVAAIAIAISLIPGSRQPVLKLGLSVGVVVLVVGLIGSASRGGLLAAGVAILASLFIFQRQRSHVVAMLVVLVGLAALALAAAPTSLERMTDFDDDNGRSDLWYVAWEMGKDRPLTGVGQNNFRLEAPTYATDPGGPDNVRNVVADPHFVHNTYLQLFAEGGVPAVVLFLSVVIGCLIAARKGAALLDERGMGDLATVGRGAIVATISVMTAAIFLSAGLDMRLWVLLALGPATLAIAQRGDAAPATAVADASPTEGPMTGRPIANPASTAPRRDQSHRLRAL